MEPCLPNLIVIGAMKCGTTSLHYYLNQHPDISMSEVKEINYFVPQFHGDKSLEWYKNHFTPGTIYRGESSQNYSKRHLVESVASNIKKTTPDVKLIYIIRNPLDRYNSHLHEAISQNNKDVNYNPNEETEEDLLNSNYVLTGKYYYQLEPFLQSFPEQQIKLVLLEDLKDDFVSSMNDVFKWLNLRELQANELKKEVRNTFLDKKVPNLLGRIVGKPSINKKIKYFVPKGSGRFLSKFIDLKKATTKNFSPVEINLRTKQILAKAFMEDLNKLRDYVNDSRVNGGLSNKINQYIISLSELNNENY